MKYLLLILLTGCCPISVRPQLVHVSHISQHFGAVPTNYGYNEVALDLHLEPVKHLMLDIAEGEVLNASTWEGYGALSGPRETFSATVAWDIPVRR